MRAFDKDSFRQSAAAENGRSRVLLISQSKNPDWVWRVLLTSAVLEGWIVIIVNFNTAIFFGLILLTAGFGEFQSMILLAGQIVTTSIAVVVLLILVNKLDRLIAARPRLVMRWVIFNDAMIMLGWGLCAILFLWPTDYERATYEHATAVLLLLTLAAIISSALTAQLFSALLIGRTLIFLPAFVYFLVEQPPGWGFHGAMAILAYGLAIGVGYAIHLQHLRQACLQLELHETLDTLQVQSENLSATLEDEQRSRAQLARETALREYFLHSVTHDLRQPINALGLFLLDLRRRLAGARDKQVLDASQSCIVSANGIIDSVAQLAWIKEHLPRAEIEAVELNPVFERVASECQPLAMQKSLGLRFIPTSIAVKADPAFLERAIRNLLHNAIQYTDQGRVLLGARRRRGGEVEIQVIDTGRGISPQEREKIFNEFYQGPSVAGRALGNVGLGLSIVTNLAEAMGGQVTLASSEGRGSMFGLRLPRTVPPLSQREPGDSAATALSGKSVLLIEDNEAYSQIICEMLASAGLSVRSVTAPDAIAAIGPEAIRAQDLLIADYQLAPGLTALDLLTPCRSEIRHRCLIISEHSLPQTVHDIKRGGWHFLRKPFTNEMLIGALSRLVA
jgi:signal transduction histidine kinase